MTALPIIALIIVTMVRAHSSVGFLPATRIAVLPLTTVGADSAATAINRQLTELVVERLTNVTPTLEGVVGPATTARLAGDTRPHTILGAGLRVDYVLSGGVRASDTTVFVQVIRVRDGSDIVAWRKWLDALTLPAMAADIAAKVVAKLEQPVGPR